MNKSTLEVWVDSDTFNGLQRVGTMHHEHGHIRFDYAESWLVHPHCFNIDPHLSLHKGSFHPHPDISSFGMLLDSSPDRWGQTLIKRREAQQAKDENRKPRILYSSDYLLGVQDETRQGALRFKYEGTDKFLDNSPLPAPPVSKLKELEQIAIELSSKLIDDMDKLKRWLSVLVAPGSSLGGVRPKANFTDNDGSLWIAKFPAKDDIYDVAAWEKLSHNLAKKALIDVPEAKLIKMNSEHHTFCVKRFDRHHGNRIFYASAMTLLEATSSEDRSYLDLAQAIQNNGDPNFIKGDLEQMFRRLVFNVSIGNRDDHLRNHGFILNKKGWQLSKAFDVNPDTDKASHVLNLNDMDNTPDMQNVLETASFYDLNEHQASSIINQIVEVVADWQNEAKKMAISRADIQLMESAFLSFEDRFS